MLTRIRDRPRAWGSVLMFCGLLLVPWLLYLSFKLPDTTRARNWSLMWTGVDLAEAVGLVVTGVLLWRRSPHRALPAAFTSALLALDAWVDVTTSAPGHARTLALVMALLIEVPAAVGCLVLAVSAFPTRQPHDRRSDAPTIPSTDSKDLPQIDSPAGERAHVDVREDVPEPTGQFR
ncbi:hypothetical protein ABIB25_002635 [Nakamurella sp. UYEF19]|uniref:hypothetical protein n=1 Tax=Nakamurella sp. UYEF19 TaxID=1756392 RepID=UPI0033988D86